MMRQFVIEPPRGCDKDCLLTADVAGIIRHICGCDVSIRKRFDVVTVSLEQAVAIDKLPDLAHKLYGVYEKPIKYVAAQSILLELQPGECWTLPAKLQRVYVNNGLTAAKAGVRAWMSLYGSEDKVDVPLFLREIRYSFCPTHPVTRYLMQTDEDGVNTFGHSFFSPASLTYGRTCFENTGNAPVPLRLDVFAAYHYETYGVGDISYIPYVGPAIMSGICGAYKDSLGSITRFVQRSFGQHENEDDDAGMEADKEAETVLKELRSALDINTYLT